MDVFILHFILSIILFLIINWIGKHSYSLGYIEISLFVKTEEAPAFNFLIRVLTPVVYLVVSGATLYYFGLDRYVINIYFVSLYYIVFRLVFNLITNRGLLLNWYRQLLYWIAIMTISFFIYENVIKHKAKLLPDFATISNELWIIILVFLFQVANNIRLSPDASYKRKQSYIKRRFNRFARLYGKLIKETANNEILEALIYAILIYEDFNRPRVIRIVENINHKLTKKPHTLGVMQVRSDTIISDYKSVQLGAQMIVDSYNVYVKEVIDEKREFYEHSAFYQIISCYNGGSAYSAEVEALFSIIKENFYKETKDSLNPIERVNLSKRP